MTSEEMNIKVLKDTKKSKILYPEPILETKHFLKEYCLYFA